MQGEPNIETCQGCGVKFERAKWKVRRSKFVFCSHSCYLKNYERGQTFMSFTCLQCGVGYQRSLGKVNRHDGNRFCSRTCHREWQKTNEPKGKDRADYTSVQVMCAACGNQIERQPYRIRDYEKQFCNKKCAGKWRSDNHVGPSHPLWKGGDLAGYRGPNWKRISTQARKRDGYRCQSCGIHEKKVGRLLDVHHIKPFRTFGYLPGENDYYLQANELSNLISLCQTCHRNAEWGNIPLQPMMLWAE